MNKSPKLICKNVWKLYGNKPKEFYNNTIIIQIKKLLKKMVIFKPSEMLL